jgi:ActR/RegA family two-component response regulator
MAESSSIPGTTKPAADMNTDSIRDKTVLVLEDEPLIALDLKFGLESGGSVVQCAYTLEQGLDILKTEVIDAAILDVNLGRDTTAHHREVIATLCSVME